MNLCYICGQPFPGRDARAAHIADVHPGFRVAWVKGEGDGTRAGRGFGALTITDPAGVARVVTGPEMQKLKRAAIARESGKPARGPGRPRRIEDLGPPADGSTDGQAGPKVDPPASGPGPRVSQPPVHPTIGAVQGSVRDAVRDAFDVTVLADIIRDFSVTLSEADGAGEPGHLSKAQAMMLSKLMYDSTVDAIVDRFGGNVGRFKMALAALVILLSKGSVHARAIAEKVNARGFTARGAAVPPPAGPPAVPDYAANYVEPLTGEPARWVDQNSEPLIDLDGPPGLATNGHAVEPDVIADLARRQRTYAEQPRTSS
jgi:hypothetical protein